MRASMALSPVMMIIFIILSSLIIPAVNILDPLPGVKTNLRDPKSFYNVDFLKRAAARVLLPMGISMDPQNVVIGKGGWLFLGDEHANTVSVRRSRGTEADRKRGIMTGAALRAWSDYLKEQGVGTLRVIFGPDKGTIYPEREAGWMTGQQPSVLDAFLAGAGDIYIDPRKAILSAKQTNSLPVYYPTDTHWNLLGAAAAFRQFATDMASVLPDVRWPAAELYMPGETTTGDGGDLANFLALTSVLREVEPRTLLLDLGTAMRRTDWESGKLLYEGVTSLLNTPMTPELVQTPGALNKKKVLWLRDSFGTGLSPYMTYTFSDVLHVHWREGLKLGQLNSYVERWRPDYVFITVVERAIQSDVFVQMPPLRGRAAEDIRVQPLEIVEGYVHDVAPGATSDEMTVTGNDPHVAYAISESSVLAGIDALRLSLSCSGEPASVRVQLFWATRATPNFAEARSVHFVYETARPVLPLLPMGLSDVVGDLTAIRVDISDPKLCPQFRLHPPEFGRLETHSAN